MDMEQAFGGTPMTMHMEGVASPSGTLPPILAGETQAVMDQLAGLYADLLGDMMDVTFTMETRDTLTAEGDFYIYPQGYNESERRPQRVRHAHERGNADGEGGFANIEGYYSPADGVYYHLRRIRPHLHFGTPATTRPRRAVQTQHADGHEYYGAQLTPPPHSGAQSAYFTYEGDYAENALGTEDNEGRLLPGRERRLWRQCRELCRLRKRLHDPRAVDPSALPAGRARRRSFHARREGPTAALS